MLRPRLMGSPVQDGQSATPSGDRGPPKDRAAGEVVFSDGSRIHPDELMRLQILRRVGLESVVGLLERCTLRTLEPGDMLLSRGQSNQTMYLLLAGRLSVHLDSPEGEPRAFLEPGQTVGEISVLDDSPASAFIRAVAPTRLIAIHEEAFWGLVWASHEFAMNLLLLLSQRMRANNSALSEGVRQRRQLERDAFTDALTGCHNRRWLDDRLPRMVQRHLRANAPLSLLMIDVDHFKRFNDDHGHVAGDCVLSTVAKAMMASLRPTDLAARFGGEEFVVMLPGTAMDGAAVAAERVRSRVARTGVVAPDERLLAAVTISIGAATLAPDDTSATLIERADGALYRAKLAGRNRTEFE